LFIYIVMRYALFSILLLLVSLTTTGQYRMGHGAISPPGNIAVSPTVYTDDFELLTPGPLATQGNWIQIHNNMEVTDVSGDNIVNGNQSSNRSCVGYDVSFSNDHYSQIVIDNLTASQGIGPAVRATVGSNYYAWVGRTGASQLVRVVSGSAAQLAAGDGWSITDVIKLSVTGTTISCYKNGILDTSIDTDGMVTDATISTGIPGICGYENDEDNAADEWEGSNN